MLAHVFGIAGELLNLCGAIVMALDIFRREREREFDESIAMLNALGVANLLERTYYAGKNVTSSTFKKDVRKKRAYRLGLLGVGLLAVGFSFLVAYHFIEIRESYDMHMSCSV